MIVDMNRDITLVSRHSDYLSTASGSNRFAHQVAASISMAERTRIQHDGNSAVVEKMLNEQVGGASIRHKEKAFWAWRLKPYSQAWLSLTRAELVIIVIKFGDPEGVSSLAVSVRQTIYSSLSSSLITKSRAI